MGVTKINREEKTIEITKNDGDIIDFSFDEVDELITFLYKMKYINYYLTLKYNHYLPEIKFAKEINGKWTTKTL